MPVFSDSTAIQTSADGPQRTAVLVEAVAVGKARAAIGQTGLQAAQD